MEPFATALRSLANPPLLAFAGGALFSLWRGRGGKFLPKSLSSSLLFYLLFAIGLKGGGACVSYGIQAFCSPLLAALLGWGFLHPFLSYLLLRRTTSLDLPTAAAVAASFGSVSVMTFVTALSFLEQGGVAYQKWLIGALSLLEIPAIVAGLLLVRRGEKKKLREVLAGALFNRALFALGCGLVNGAFLEEGVKGALLVPFSPLLTLFMAEMGSWVGAQRHAFRLFSWPLVSFALYTPLLGAFVGILLAWSFGLDRGSSTLVAVLTASASYIAVPAAMRVSLPEAQEAVYLPLSLGIAFPFNVLIGIPLYDGMIARWWGS